MRVLGFLIWIVLASSLTFASVPAQLRIVPETNKADCCAKMKAEVKPHACDRHAPQSDDDKHCCAACALGCAVLANAGTPFVYPSTGDEKFAAFISSERLRSDRPPVPPPRA